MAAAAGRRPGPPRPRPRQRPDTAGWTSSSASSTTTSPPPASAAASPSHPTTTTSRGPGGPGPPAAARTPRTCPSGRFTTDHRPHLHGPDGKTWRPSMFLTLTCDSYGKVGPDGTPADPGQLRLPAGRTGRAPLPGAVRPAHPEPAPLPRLRRPVLRHHRAAETPRPARPPRLPRRHLPRRPAAVIAATYHQVWWPPTARRLGRTSCPSGTSHPAVPRPGTGELLPTWDQALDAIGPHDQPLHVARFGPKFDAQGVLAGTKDAGRCIGYLTKYLTKQLAACHTDSNAAAADTPPGSSTRCGTSPAHPPARTGSATASSPGTPGPACGPDTAGAKPTAARTSATPDAASWSPANGPARPSPTTAPTAKPGSSPPSASDLPATDPGRYNWERVTPDDPDHIPPTAASLHVLTDRARWQAALHTPAHEQQSQPSFGNRAGGSVMTGKHRIQ